MNWTSLILQIFSFHKSMNESKAVIEAAQRMAAKGKNLTIFALASLLSLFFILSGVVTFIIEFGLQMDRGNALHLSGLVISSILFISIGATILLASSILLKKPNMEIEIEEPSKKPSDNSDKIKELLEEFILVFLSQMIQNTTNRSSRKQNEGKNDEPK